MLQTNISHINRQNDLRNFAKKTFFFCNDFANDFAKKKKKRDVKRFILLNNFSKGQP